MISTNCTLLLIGMFMIGMAAGGSAIIATVEHMYSRPWRPYLVNVILMVIWAAVIIAGRVWWWPQ